LRDLYRFRDWQAHEDFSLHQVFTTSDPTQANCALTTVEFTVYLTVFDLKTFLVAPLYSNGKASELPQKFQKANLYRYPFGSI